MRRDLFFFFKRFKVFISLLFFFGGGGVYSTLAAKTKLSRPGERPF